MHRGAHTLPGSRLGIYINFSEYLSVVLLIRDAVPRVSGRFHGLLVIPPLGLIALDFTALGQAPRDVTTRRGRRSFAVKRRRKCLHRGISITTVAPTRPIPSGSFLPNRDCYTAGKTAMGVSLRLEYHKLKIETSFLVPERIYRVLFLLSKWGFSWG